jgi:hypothetical protein
MRTARVVVLGFAALVDAHAALAQATLGDLIDAGAKRVSASEFREDVVQRVVAGVTPLGGRIELMYARDGGIQGTGQVGAYDSKVSPYSGLDGEWIVETGDRICTTMRLSAGTTARAIVLPRRCQYWFKLDTRYFLADSDTDRSAKVLVRTIKQ